MYIHRTGGGAIMLHTNTTYTGMAGTRTRARDETQKQTVEKYSR
jgi:hypothetical protein